MGKLDRIYYFVFGDFVCSRLNHHNAVFCADHHDVEQALAPFRITRVDHHLAIHDSDANCAYRSGKWNVRQGNRTGRRVNRGHVRIILGISRKHERNHLGFVLEVFREQWPDGTINLPRGKNFAFARTALSLDKSARNASTSIGVLAVIDG